MGCCSLWVFSGDILPALPGASCHDGLARCGCNRHFFGISNYLPHGKHFLSYLWVPLERGQESTCFSLPPCSNLLWQPRLLHIVMPMTTRELSSSSLAHFFRPFITASIVIHTFRSCTSRPCRWLV